jgi:hypothetical protein
MVGAAMMATRHRQYDRGHLDGGNRGRSGAPIRSWSSRCPNLGIFNNTEFLMLTLISMTQAIVAILINATTDDRRRRQRLAGEHRELERAELSTFCA